MMSMTVTFKANRNGESARRSYGQLRRQLPKDIGMSLKGRLSTSLVGIALKRGLIGSTGAVVKKGNWVITPSSIGEGHYQLDVRNPKAPYVGYLNRPDGPYPLDISLKKIRSWMSKKSHLPANWENARRLARQLAQEGHRSKKGRGFVQEAARDSLHGFPPVFRTIVRNIMK